MVFKNPFSICELDFWKEKSFREKPNLYQHEHERKHARNGRCSNPARNQSNGKSSRNQRRQRHRFSANDNAHHHQFNRSSISSNVHHWIDEFIWKQKSNSNHSSVNPDKPLLLNCWNHPCQTLALHFLKKEETKMSIYIIPTILILLFIYCFVKNVNAYNHFISGARSAVDLCISTFPYLVAIFIAVELFKLSGLNTQIAKLVEPLFKLLGIPSELVDFMIIRPFSGSGSMAMLRELYSTYGADSYISHCASVIVSATDTVFYIVAVYFSTTKIKRLKATIPLALLSTFIGSLIACLICKFI